MELATGWCSKCVRVVDFERPECGEHLDDCPELICLLCGAAYFGGDDAYYVAAAVSTTPINAADTPAA